MRLDALLALVLAAGFAVTTTGCPADDESGAPSSSTGSGGAGGQGGAVAPALPPVSVKATVKFKSKERLVNDFRRALLLTDDQACLEVGTYVCEQVHGIALGGVDAYDAGIYEPLPASAVTTPIAVDRIALHLCQRRAHEDLKDPTQAKIFQLKVDGGRTAADDPATVAAITTLFHRIHLREPTEREVTLLQQLYDDIAASGADQPAKDWAALSCYAVISMMESVFY